MAAIQVGPMLSAYAADTRCCRTAGSIVKEAQHMQDIEKLESYVENPAVDGFYSG
jgi:hypothetical protein